jgi:penicillin-binding protein 2
MGLKLGVDRFDKYGRQFGFGSKTGIDLDGESSGLLPGLKYLNQRYGENKWSRGLLANLAIGQGEVLVTPLQLAVYVSAIATGYLVQPHLANHLVDPVSREVRHVTPSVKPLQLDRWVLDDVREAMRRVVNEPGGTAFWLKNKDIEIAGKTGTAQNPHGKDHALFVAFAPFKDPVIAVAVVVEHGEHGSTCAAPIACELIKKYLIKESADSLQVIAPDSLETHNGSPLE